MKKTLTSISLILIIQMCYSQDSTFEYLPKNKDSLFIYINKIAEKKIIKLGAKNKKEINKIITERKENLIKEINDSTYIFNNKISKHLKSILSEISKSNPTIDFNNFYFLLDKSIIPNASCHGNGIFTVNLGLFKIIQNDDELAFVISHEIAHYVLEHSDKSILSYVESSNSKESKIQLEKVNKLEYGKRKAYSELMKNLSYNFLKRSRKAEIQADSLGLVILKKTKYNSKASIAVLKKLDISDKLLFNEDSNLKACFDFENYPFKLEWLNKEENLFDIKEKADDYALDKDSIKTHPDIPLRIKLIDNEILTKTNENYNLNDIEEIKKIAAESSIYVYLNNLTIDLALYQTLLLYNKNQLDQKSYCDIISSLIKKIYDTKKNHSFGKYIGSISPFSDEKYLNEIRCFLNNLDLKDVKKIGLNFCKKHEAFMKNNINFNNTKEYFIKLNLN